jgi:hypothetical protein|tara:strand:+ start:51 stop:224 length:174 start_codon:yes stop_codon:yes gene_type:complete
MITPKINMDENKWLIKNIKEALKQPFNYNIEEMEYLKEQLREAEERQKNATRGKGFG